MTEKQLQELLKGSHAKVHVPRMVRPLDGPGVRVQTPAAKEPKSSSEIEELLAAQIDMTPSLPRPIRQYHHLRGRAHTLDFAWPDHRINGMQFGCEVQGMVHRIKSRFAADLEKRYLGQLQGWFILEVGGEQIRNGKAIEWILSLMAKADSA